MGQKKGKRSNSAARSLQNILGGNFLTKEATTKHLPFLLFLAFLALIYIGNIYYAEKNIRRTEKLQKELKELRYEYVSVKSKLLQNSQQSKVAMGLASKGIKESTVPPNKIFVEER